jgi:hypothetical protein
MNLIDPSTLCLFLLAAIVILLMFRTRGRLDRQRRQPAEAEPPEGGTTNARGPLPDDLARWEVQMQETARRLSAQLDAKLSLLQALTAEADRAAQRLEEALDRTHPALPPGSQAESLRPIAEGPHDVAAEPDRVTVELEPAANTDRSRRREEIYQLADYGFAPAEIARRVGSPVGEVELILSLRQS